MADNTTLNLGTGGDAIATDDIAGVKYQRVKVTFGADGFATDVSATDKLPVTGDFYPATQPVSGPLTDAQLRATAVPVSGTFFQATQPVSAASLPLPAGAATETSLAGVRTDLGTDGTTPPAVLGAGTGVRGWLRSIYEKLTGSIAVTGTFWQATQPVSGPLTDTQLRATAVPVSGTFFQAAQPVTDNAGSLTVDAPVGTPVFVRLSDGTTAIATLPVSLATLPTLAAGTNNIGDVDVLSLPALPAGTNNIGDVDVLTLPALPAGTNTIGTTLGPALTKGTQGATGYSTQDLKDSGRTLFSACTVIAGVTAVATEALLTMVPTRAGVAAATATSQAVTAGKTMRLTDITVGLISTGASVLSGRFALRMNPTGAVTATSPILKIIPIPSGAALAQAGGSITIPLPEGFEFSGTQQFGLTQVCSAATGTVWASIGGNEY